MIECFHIADFPKEVQHHQFKFIDAMQSLFERHKAAAGHPELKFRIL